MNDRHAPHIWHPDARGVLRCGFQDCPAEPTPEDAAWAIAEAEARFRSRVDIDYGRRHAQDA
jgi:hypothetical protein